VVGLHDVAIRFSSRTLILGSQYCTLHCNRTPTVVHTDSLTPKVAHEEPAVSAGAGEFGAGSFTSPKFFFQNQVNDRKDNAPDFSDGPPGMSTRSPDLSDGLPGMSTRSLQLSTGLPETSLRSPQKSIHVGPHSRPL